MPSVPEIVRARSARTRRLRAKGLSLTELVMVLVVMGVAAAVGAPRYGAAVMRYRADAAAKRIVADLGMAQSQAKMTSKSQVVTFDTTGISYQAPGVLDLKRSAATYKVDLSASPFYAAALTATFNSQAQVSFDMYGCPNAGGTITVRVGSMTKTITVDAITGKATIQ